MPQAQAVSNPSHARSQARIDLVGRSFAGPIGCLLTVGVVSFTTPIWHDHSVPAALFCGIMLFRLAVRLVLTIAWKRRCSRPVEFPEWLVAASAYTLSLPAGLFAAFASRQYGYESWTTLVLFAFVVSCAVGGSVTLAPLLRSAMGFQLTLLAPLLMGSAFDNDPRATVVTAALALFTIYVLIQTKRSSAEYWEKLSAELMLKAGAAELQDARIAAEAANEAKTRFLANISHELRTPMNGVLGMLELVRGMNLGAEQRDYVECAQESARGLLRLLDDILDHSKAEAGRLELEAIDFAVRRVVADSVAIFQGEAAKKRIGLHCTVKDDVPAYLRGDPGRLRQVLSNLLSNAIKFTQTGSVSVSVSPDRTIDGSMLLHFEVADTGPGIPDDRRQRVFEAFAQADDSITRRYGGTGLGLAICRELVALMGGRIWLESEVGRGSTFHFTAEFAVRFESASISDTAVLAPLVTPGPRLSILVVEDNAINQKLMTAFLTRAGHSCAVASNGLEALTMHQDSHYDVILMDVQMPEMDGLEATRRIRAAGQATGRHVPIIGITAGAAEGDHQACLDAGMDSCIKKPVSFSSLEQLLSRLAPRSPIGAGATVSG